MYLYSDSSAAAAESRLSSSSRHASSGGGAEKEGGVSDGNSSASASSESHVSDIQSGRRIFGGKSDSDVSATLNSSELKALHKKEANLKETGVDKTEVAFKESEVHTDTVENSDSGGSSVVQR